MNYMKNLVITICFFLCIQGVYAQYIIKGNIKDTVNNSPLPNAAITLINAKDSSLATYARAGADGSFELHVDTVGKFTILITFPGFADYVDKIQVKEKITDLGLLPMITKSHLLKEFVLNQHVGAIKIKGDTTEYMADSFKVKDNATVEELLKRLPGIEVNKNGDVVAQGQKVEKILVDGEEFFSDDPAVVTKGLAAKTVDKVQVFDKKSDDAAFTGIDDGQKIKTINLELKDDMKKGYFGKAEAGGGTDGYFQNQAMINAFKGKRQLSAFGIAANTGQVGLGWSDQNKYSSGNGVTEINDEGQVMTTFTSSDDDMGGWDGKYNGQGLPKAWTGGVHYADKWNEDKEHLTGNYRFGKQNIEMQGDVLSQYVLPNDSGYYTKQRSTQFSSSTRNVADMMFEWKTDSLTTIKLTVDGGTKNASTNSIYYNETLKENGDTINKSLRNITNNIVGQFLNADLNIRKKFNKKGRTLSIDFKENYKDSRADGHLNSQNSLSGDFVTLPIGTDSAYAVDQRKQSDFHSLEVQGKINYTEPLSKVAYLILNYGLSINNSTSQNNSYNKPSGGDEYNLLDSVYSSHFAYNILNHVGGANLRFVYKKINFSFGSDVSDAIYKQVNYLRDTTYRYDYLNLFPKASFNYKIDRQTSLTLNYYGSTRQPTIDQIQPLLQNTDPLNIAKGNQNLKQEFDNRVSANFYSYKVLSGRYIYSSVSFNQSNNAISQSTNTDSFGRRVYQYINVNGNYSGWGYLSYGFKLSKLDMNLGANVNSGITHSNNLVNGVENVSDNRNYTFGLDINYEKEKKLSIYFNPSVTYTSNKAMISTYTANYWASDNTLSGTLQLPLNFEISTSLNWMIRQKTVVFDNNNNVLKWNAHVSKKFLKNKELELRASVNDILNQNIGYMRSAQDNYITQNTYNTIRRYGMISLIWNFTKTPKVSSAAPATESIIIK